MHASANLKSWFWWLRVLKWAKWAQSVCWVCFSQSFLVMARSGSEPPNWTANRWTGPNQTEPPWTAVWVLFSVCCLKISTQTGLNRWTDKYHVKYHVLVVNLIFHHHFFRKLVKLIYAKFLKKILKPKCTYDPPPMSCLSVLSKPGTIHTL